MAELKLVIGADVKPAEQALKAFVSNIDKVGTSIGDFSSGASRIGTSINKAFGTLPLGNIKSFRDAILSLKSDLSNVKISVIPPIRLDVGQAQQSLKALASDADKTSATIERFSAEANKSFSSLSGGKVIPIDINVAPAQQSLRSLSGDAQRTGAVISQSFGKIPIDLGVVEAFRKTFLTLKSDLSNVKISALPPVTIDTSQAQQSLKTLVSTINQSGASVQNFSADAKKTLGPLPLDIEKFRQTFIAFKSDLDKIKIAAIPPITADIRPAQVSLKILADEVKKTTVSVDSVSDFFSRFSTDVNKSLGALSVASLDNFKKAFLDFKSDLSNVKISALPPVTIDISKARQSLQNLVTNVDQTITTIRADLTNVKVAAIPPVDINTAPAEQSLKELVTTVNNTISSFRNVGSDINKSFSALPFNIEKFRQTFLEFKADLSNVKITPIPPVNIDINPAQQSLKNLVVDVDKTIDVVKADLSNIKITALPPIAADIRPAQQSFKILVDEAARTGSAITGISTSIQKFGADVRTSLGALPLHNIEAFRNAFLDFKKDLGSIKIAAIPPVKVDTTSAQQSFQTLSQEAQKTGTSVSGVAVSFERFSRNIAQSFGALPLSSIAAFRDAFLDFKSDLSNVKISSIPPVKVDTSQAQLSLKTLTDEAVKSSTTVSSLSAAYQRWAAQAATSSGTAANALKEVSQGLTVVEGTSKRSFGAVVINIDQAGAAVNRFSGEINKSLSALPFHNIAAFKQAFLDLKANLSKVTIAAIPPIDLNIRPAINTLKTLVDNAQRTGVAVFEGLNSGLNKSFGRAPLQDLTKLRQAFAAFKDDVSRFKIAPINSQFAPSVTRATNALKQVPAVSSAATLSLLNLGRVVQDAPFGFLGIANNLNPLLESFQRLKATTGTTGGALKALSKSLMGAGGLGFALSIASSLLIVFGDRLFGIGNKTGKTNEELEETTRRIKELLRPLSEIGSVATAGTAEELAKVSVLSKAVLDQTKSYEQRNNALNQLKKINESYFGDLTLESAKLGVLTERVKEYTKAIIAQAVIKGFSDEIGKLSVELDKQDRAYNDAGKALDTYNKKLANTKESQTSLTGEDRISQEFVDAKKAVRDASREFDKQGKTVGDLRNRMFQLRGAIEEAINASLDFRPLEITKPTGGKDPGDDLQKFITRAKQLNSELEKIGFIAPVQFSFFDSLQEEFEKAKKVFADFNSGNLKIDPKIFTFPSFSEPEIKERVNKAMDMVAEGIRAGIIKLPAITLKVQLEEGFINNESVISEEAKNFAIAANKELAKAFKTFKLNVLDFIDFNQTAGFNLDVITETLRKALHAARNLTLKELIALAGDVQKSVDFINTTLTNMKFEGVIALGEALGTALASGDVGAVFKNFGNVIANGLQAIGKELITMSGVIKAVKLALTSGGLNPAALLAGGISLIAIAAALRTALSKGIPGFAQGGLVTGPVLGLIGEGVGTSRSNPEVIAPLDQLKRMLGDISVGPQVVVLATKVRSKDLILLQARGTRSQRRLG